MTRGSAWTIAAGQLGGQLGFAALIDGYLSTRHRDHPDYGDRDAIHVDTLITYDQVDALAGWIDTKGRRLSRIYITHGHGDHWLGLARLIDRSPGAIGLATAEVLAQAADPAMAGFWEALFPGEIPVAGEKVPPQLLTADALDLEGNELRVLRIGQADTAHSTALHTVAGRRRHRGPGLQPGAHDDRRDRRTRNGQSGSPTWTPSLGSNPPSSSPVTSKLTTTTTRRSSPNPSNTCGTSPGSPLRRPPRPASSSG
jgi:hypothetical protein